MTIAATQAVSLVRPHSDTPGRRLTASRTPRGRRATSPAGTAAPPWASPRKLAIFGALPEGTRRAPSQAAWVHAVQAHPDVAALRADAHANLMRVVWVLARHADWTELVTRPTWAVLMDRTGLSRSTVAAWLAWLRRAGLLGTVTPGTTVRYRRGTACGLLDDGRGNEAAEYVLAVPAPAEDATTDRAEAERKPAETLAPAGRDRQGQAPASDPVEGTRTPSGPPSGGLSSRPSRAREAMPDSSDTGWWWSRAVTPATRRDSLAAAHRARNEDVTLRALSPRHVRSLLRPIFAEGGTLADALHMINHRPDGTEWPFAGMPRYVPGWVRHRLAAWLTEDGRLRPGVELPSRQKAAAAAKVADELAARRTQRAELETRRAADVTGHADRARALLAASPAAAAAMRRRSLGIAPRSRWLPPGSTS
ncbi:helix-turn-helix domain-containing protein [Microbispora sp. NPDC088329]|uniref:helix-turn-helix domain-containing protein n=1 Tax=Microbispora sp. NPDC088329 TaxID=3154869 RepID=UPI00342007FC